MSIGEDLTSMSKDPYSWGAWFAAHDDVFGDRRPESWMSDLELMDRGPTLGPDDATRQAHFENMVPGPANALVAASYVTWRSMQVGRGTPNIVVMNQGNGE
ncbi:MAG TPA: hypothetical protein VF466_01200 [Candidatus Saccharimonadales bacterium]